MEDGNAAQSSGGKESEGRGGERVPGGGNNQGNVRHLKKRDDIEANTGLTAAGEATISKRKKKGAVFPLRFALR